MFLFRSAGITTLAYLAKHARAAGWVLGAWSTACVPPASSHAEVSRSKTCAAGWVAGARSAVGSPPRQLERSTSSGAARASGEGGVTGGGGATGTVASGARALSLLCHWGVCRTKGEAADHWRAPGEPHVRVVLQACTLSGRPT